MSDGLQAYCKECAKQYSDSYGKVYRASHAERISARLARYYAENKERVLDKKRARRATAQAKKRDRDRHLAYYQEHKTEYKERSYEWRRQNPDKERRNRKMYRENHPQQIAESRAQYRRANPEAVAAHTQRRRARQAGAYVGDVDFKRIYKRDRDICYLCGRKVKKSERHLDHVIPLSRGGAHSEDNIRVTHARCNLKKGVKLVEELDLETFRS
jgi:5-methylcytosine-specific restriction endonuclease McrA